jgi:hypothetical protein
MVEEAPSIVEAPSEDYLADYLNPVRLPLGNVPWGALSARPKNALRRAVAYSGNPKVADSPYFRFSDISSITVGDLKDQRNVGAGTLNDLINELNQAFSTLSEDDLVEPSVEEEDKLVVWRRAIIDSTNLEELSEAMLTYQITVNEVSEREIEIWKSRLPWFTDSPDTLATLGEKFGVTRERVRQIQRRVERYPFLISEPVKLLQEFQNLLLETSSFLEFEEDSRELGLFSGESLNPGRIRHIAIALEQKDLVEEIGAAIHKWNRISMLGMDED